LKLSNKTWLIIAGIGAVFIIAYNVSDTSSSSYQGPPQTLFGLTGIPEALAVVAVTGGLAAVIIGAGAATAALGAGAAVL
jgi:hypothetical protein